MIALLTITGITDATGYYFCAQCGCQVGGRKNWDGTIYIEPCKMCSSTNFEETSVTFYNDGESLSNEEPTVIKNTFVEDMNKRWRLQNSRRRNKRK